MPSPLMHALQHAVLMPRASYRRRSCVWSNVLCAVATCFCTLFTAHACAPTCRVRTPRASYHHRSCVRSDVPWAGATRLIPHRLSSHAVCSCRVPPCGFAHTHHAVCLLVASHTHTGTCFGRESCERGRGHCCRRRSRLYSHTSRADVLAVCLVGAAAAADG